MLAIRFYQEKNVCFFTVTGVVLLVVRIGIARKTFRPDQFPNSVYSKHEDLHGAI